MPTKSLSAREALAIADYESNHPTPFADTCAFYRRDYRDHASDVLRRLLRLGFKLVPIVSKKGRKRG